MPVKIIDKLAVVNTIKKKYFDIIWTLNVYKD